MQTAACCIALIAGLDLVAEAFICTRFSLCVLLWNVNILQDPSLCVVLLRDETGYATFDRSWLRAIKHG
jgi:hypothetical protein